MRPTGCCRIIAVLGLLPLPGAGQSDLKLWYTRPAPIWTEALPVGNGHLGAMVFGGANRGANNGDQEDARANLDILDGRETRAQDEHLQLNESTVWHGARTDKLNPRAREGFLKVRNLLLESKGEDGAKIAEAERIAAGTMIPTPRGMPGYSTLGDLYVRSAAGTAATGYRRELDLETGVVTVTYTAGGVHYQRQVFASAPDGVIVLHLTADKPGSLTFTVSLDRPADFEVRALSDHDLALTPGIAHKDQINFHGQVRVLYAGGKIESQDNAISLGGANEATLLIAAATDFRGESPSKQCAAALDAAAKKSFSALRAAAVADEESLMRRAGFHLGTPDAALAALPTDERLRRVSAGGTDLGLQALYFQFGRYLLAGSSRPGGIPATLQGLWASGIDNPWGSKWTININTEMNYWIAEAANLSELHLPLFDLLDMVSHPGSGTGMEVAAKYYGARGFVIHHNTDIWGDAHPIDGVPYGIWPMGGAWLTLHAWDHYAFSGDKRFLRERAWPLLHDASLFFLDYLTGDGAGHLVTGPSLSPENRYKLPDGTAHSLTMGPTMDIEIVRELFQRTIQAGAILKAKPEFCRQVSQAMAKLPPFRIGQAGNLQEWQEDYADAEPGHRHISHLWALYPGTQITLQHTPELAKAARIALERRLAARGGQTGWSRAWVVNYWDHLGEGEQAYESMAVLFRQSTFPNLMDTHPPGVFQIDGNLGGANGMLEAIVQSRWYPDHAEVDLLPALPREWGRGSVSGIRVRGGAELALEWDEGKVRSSRWRASQDETFEIRLPAGQNLRRWTENSHVRPVLPGKAGAVRVAVHKGGVYEFAFE
ncbi:MAG TPA: glycoside hydrolase family 95 protein [Bryobacteraceae bacterium]|nr:glycoside hydrolase family 95 protein [Bryobacteraceae bacterium]